ncbi:fibronectin type III domain-containing protein [Flavobacterium soyae]|uniref:Fibronectin type III domain-containing protein n=1 Tax=Flavobacterium soyae TaxID=2903098 RepID=A0ABZ2UKD3_9FLAO
MKKLLKYTFLLILLTQCSPGGWGNVYAQLYPVQLTPVFKSPYSVKISDYATSMDTKFQLLINPTDITISQRQVRLKLYIQGNGVNIRSSDYITGQRPIFINGGEFQTLTNTDISALFRLENLQGITPSQYANPLPDGMYDFCFEMYDYITNQKISRKSCASIYLLLNDPPLLNTPQKNEQIAASDFPNIMFTWTPRQMNATNVSYKFELKQLIDSTLDPQFAFQMSPLLYEETLFSTAMLYNLSMPILTPGMRYAWRVRAISTTGLSENAIFKNDGYSEIYSFKYTASCAAPTFLLSEAQGPNSVKITWQGIPDHTKYQVQYKKQDVRNAQWFSTNSLNTQSLITNLEPGVTYQFRVGSSCDPATEGIQSFTYSAISTFTTPTQTNGVPAYNCGIIPKINIQNQKPLTNLIQSETFTAGDFPVTILELKGENSPYSGRGYIIVPYLKDTKIAVEFNNITINTDYQLINGVVETSYNPKWDNVVNVKEIFTDITSAVDGLYDLLKKKEENSITDADFVAERFDYLNKIQDQIDELKKDTDLPEELKKKIEDLKPVLLDLASNDWKASGNFSKENIDKVAQFAKEADAYKKEQAILTEKISKGINFQKLISWMQENSGNTVLFDYEKFLNEDFELTGSGLGAPTSLKIDKNFEFEVDGEKKILNFKGQLSTRKDYVTLAAQNSPIGLNIDFANSGITYDFNYLYDKIESGQDKTAIILKTNRISDYDALLGFLKYSIGETGSKAKDYVVNKFNKAFQTAGSDCNKIDFLYADAPDFIITARGNDKLWSDLQSLSKCSIHYRGTNENNSVLNILRNIDNKWIFSKQKSNIDFFADLFTKLNLDYRAHYIKVLSQIGLKNWTPDQINNSQFYLMEPLKIDGIIDQSSYSTITSWCVNNTAKTKYEIGYTGHYFEKGALVGSNEKIQNLGIIEKNDPVHIRIGENDYLIPAFITYVLTKETVADDRNIAINNALSVILPEFERLSLNKLKWLSNIGSKVDKVLFRVDEAFKAGDEAVGVLVNGKYLKNPTATKVEELIINPSGTVRGKVRLDPNASTTELLNGGEYMYVIDESDNLIIGTRAKSFEFSNPPGKAPHPTLIGGENPQVKAAGTISFKGGKIYKVDNASGHFKPSVESLKEAEEIFRKKFPTNSFTNDFQGFVPYGN